MKMTIEKINDIIKDILNEYDDLHPLTELVEHDNISYLSIHYWNSDSDKMKGFILKERIKNLVQVYGECDLVKETNGNTSATHFDVYKLVVNGN
jgi:hypothetical protein